MSTENIAAILANHKDKSVLIDSNLLLLLLVGGYNPRIVPKYKRTCQFTEDDYYTLVNFLRLFNKIITTPNILTEVSNLLGSLTGTWKEDVFSGFKEKISLLSEDFCSSAEGANCEYFSKIGLTDSVILKISKGKLLVLTEDVTLTGILQHNNVDVLNFNYIRTCNV